MAKIRFIYINFYIFSMFIPKQFRPICMIWRCKKNYFFNISILRIVAIFSIFFFVLLNSSLTTIILPFSIPSLISKDSINFCSGTCLFHQVNKYFLRQSYILNIFLNPYILINIPNCNNLYSRDQKIKQQYLLFIFIKI